MSGHSKWSTIKRDKAANDAKKSKAFTKLTRAITVAAKKGGGDTDSNAALRLVVEKAKSARMPKDNIEKAIAKGTGQNNSETFEEVIYEGYGPNGVAFLIETLTDNKNRTVAEIRSIFTHADGSLGSLGATQYIFENKENPLFFVDINDKSIAKKLILLFDAFSDHDDVQNVYVNFKISDEILKSISDTIDL